MAIKYKLTKPKREPARRRGVIRRYSINPELYKLKDRRDKRLDSQKEIISKGCGAEIEYAGLDCGEQYSDGRIEYCKECEASQKETNK